MVALSGLCLALVVFTVVAPVWHVKAEHATPTVHRTTGDATPGVPPSRRGALRARSSTDFRLDLREAMNEALGEGHDVAHERLVAIHQKLSVMWRALVRSEEDRIDRRSLRYVVHRYFLHNYGISFVGLEPLQANGSHTEAALLTQYAPAYVKNVLEGRGASIGFSVEDAAAMIMTLERLVQQSVRENLDISFEINTQAPHVEMTREKLVTIMESYALRWMLGQDAESIEMLEENKTLRNETFEDWDHIAHFVRGSVSALEYERRFASSGRGGWSPLRPRFTYADAQTIAGAVALSFGRFWETECARVKGSLVQMDRASTGRAPLSSFHAAALNGEWRFSESKEYLQQLGALDESSSWKGPQVIITNYLQSPSNCIITTPHYRVCCANECEDILGEIEAAIGSPHAAPEEVFAALANMTVSFEQETISLGSVLRDQLVEVARGNGGKVPIHGRLFSQWLHYVFPQDCPFPHKSGTTTSLTPLEFGEEFLATENEMAETAAAPEAEKTSPLAPEQDDWMAQWSYEEELVANISPPWDQGLGIPTVLLFLLAAGAASVLLRNGGLAGLLRAVGKGKAELLPTRAPVKAHYV